MVDFHTHILPKFDDGSESVEQSLEMIRALSSQSVDTIVASPHFYLGKESIDSFLERRHSTFQELMKWAQEEERLPGILLAAEVRFFEGMSYNEGIEKLRIGNSRCLLLEMPFEKWKQRTLDEVRSIVVNRCLTVIIAHFEQYLRHNGNRRYLDDLIDMGAILQINTTSFIKRSSRRVVLNFLKFGSNYVLGSDCHNMSDRQPDYNRACEVITKKLGVERLRRIDALSRRLLAEDYG